MQIWMHNTELPLQVSFASLGMFSQIANTRFLLDIIHKMSENAQFITTTFRPELLANADKFYGVTFYGKVSRIHAILKENALGFVEQESAR